MIKKYAAAFTIITCSFIYCSCGGNTKDAQAKTVNKDTANHGYDELANRDNKKAFNVSQYNTDDTTKQNINRPKTQTHTTIDTALLFGMWTSDPNGPHADFVFSDSSFFVVDYDGNGDMPYILKDKSLKVYYNDFVHEGEVQSVTKDTLQIKWKGNEAVNKYVLWKN